jgi:RNA recognition motif-containing protein
MFGAFGRIVEIRVNRDKLTGRCKGFGFVAMSREEEVDAVSIFGRAAGRKLACRVWNGRTR